MRNNKSIKKKRKGTMSESADDEQLLKQFVAEVGEFERHKEGLAQMSGEKAERTKGIAMPPKEEEEKQEKTWAFNWSDIPEDVKVEILCRFPVKDVTRFKCVSSYWNLLISSICAPMLSAPSPRASLIGFFAETRYKKSSSLYFFPSAPRFKDMRKIAIPFQPEPRQFQDSCNGLLLFQRYTSDATDYYVYNPTTGQCAQVLDGRHDTIYFTCLAFDPLVSPTSFKIIRRGCFIGQPCTLVLEIFSSETGKWKRHIVYIEHEFTEQSFYWVHRSLYWNGTLYLMSRTKFLVCFGISSTGDDPDNLTFRIVPLPGRDKYEQCGSFGVDKGHVVYSNADAREILVWKLSEGDRWIIKQTISIDELYARKKKQNPEGVEVYGFLPHSGKLLVGTPYQVHIYDPATKFMEQLYRSKRRFIFCGQHRLFPCFTCAVTFKVRRFLCK